jgi:type IV pilus assembly protein PilA
MKTFNNKSGFTLIEIIVVLIIVGILASIALPNLFLNVEKSKSAEALTAMSGYKSDVEGCIQSHSANANTKCGTFAAMGIAAPNTPNFAITLANVPADGTAATAETYTLKSVYNSNTADTITMVRNTDGSITCTGGSNFASAC